MSNLKNAEANNRQLVDFFSKYKTLAFDLSDAIIKSIYNGLRTLYHSQQHLPVTHWKAELEKR